MDEVIPIQGCEQCAPLIAALRAQNEELRAQLSEVAELRARIQALEERLGQNSSNSHKPPSSDGPEKPKKRKRKRSGRKRGGQPGHVGKARELVPVEEVDELVTVKPTECENCTSPLIGLDSAPRRHQVVEIPPVQPQVTEYQLHGLRCDCCGHRTVASLPDGVPLGAFGPRLMAIVAILGGAYRLSKRNIVLLLRDLFGVVLSVGAVASLHRKAGEALAAPFHEAWNQVKAAKRLGVDETGWKHRAKKGWLWVAVSSAAVVFLVRLSRARAVFEELVGADFEGIVGSDRYGVYAHLSWEQRQICWAHLKRDFQKMADCADSEAAAVGEKLLKQTERLFYQWHRVRDGTIKRSTLKRHAVDIRFEVKGALHRGSGCGHPKTAGMCKKILEVEDSLWTFVRREGVEPTNNAAERALRPAVIWRKLSFGTQSEAGSRFVETMLTVLGTLRLSGRCALSYLTEACKASLHGRPAPSLFPPQQDVEVEPELEHEERFVA